VSQVQVCKCRDDVADHGIWFDLWGRINTDSKDHTTSGVMREGDVLKGWFWNECCISFFAVSHRYRWHY
jgi:hypothetical protein